MFYSERYYHIKKLLKEWKPSTEYLRKLREDMDKYEEYMKLETHPADCYCSRCMSEFLKH